MVLSRSENDPSLGLIGSVAALAISDIPFPDTLAGVRVGRINDEFVINPTLSQQEESALNVIMAGTADSITMVEGGAYEVSEEIMIEALRFGHDNIRLIVAKIDELKALKAKKKRSRKRSTPNSSVASRLLATDQAVNAIVSKDERNDATELGKIAPPWGDGFRRHQKILYPGGTRPKVANDRRGWPTPDNRGFDEVRPITCDVSVLPAPRFGLFTAAKRLVTARWETRSTNSGWTSWKGNRPNRTCSTTTSRLFRSARCAPCAASAAARWVTAHWRSGPSTRSSRSGIVSHTLSGSCPISWNRTDRRRWPPSAAARWP
jgi:hypothetical protein